jgi:hypothetical protein
MFFPQGNAELKDKGKGKATDYTFASAHFAISHKSIHLSCTSTGNGKDTYVTGQ